jgi:hypothetical protein
MNRPRLFVFCVGVFLLPACSRAPAQSTAPAESPKPLVLAEAIPAPGVQGRFDHFAFDGQDQLFVAALGSNSIEVIDISARVRVESITGISNPPWWPSFDAFRMPMTSTTMLGARESTYSVGEVSFACSSKRTRITLHAADETDFDPGGGRTSGYFGKGRKGFDRFFLAVPARADPEPRFESTRYRTEPVNEW